MTDYKCLREDGCEHKKFLIISFNEHNAETQPGRSKILLMAVGLEKNALPDSFDGKVKWLLKKTKAEGITNKVTSHQSGTMTVLG